MLLRRIIAVILLCAALMACTSDTRIYGYIYMRLAENPTTLDPALIVDVTGGGIAAKLYSGLVRLGPDLEIVPDLAESWSVSPDGLTYRFTLRKGVLFHSGRELVADDVRYSFERVLSPETKSPKTWVFDKVLGSQEFMSGKLDKVTGFRVMDDRTLEIVLKEPYSPFLNLLTMPSAYVVAPEDVLRWGADFSAHASGTGPFILKQWDQNRQLVLERNARYFDGTAKIDGIVYRIIPEEITAVAEFELGNLDLLAIPASEYSRYRDSSRWQGLISTQEGINTYYLGMNCARPPFNDPELRRAVSHAIDRSRILRTLQEGRGRLARGPIPPELRRWPAPQGYDFDMARAREIIRKRNATGLKVVFYITADQQVVDMAEVIQSYLKDAGLDVRIVQLEWSGFKAAVNKGEADMFWLSWWADYPDPENFLFPLFHSSNYGPGGNRVRYANDDVDLLIRKGQSATSETGKNNFYGEAERLIVRSAPWVFFWHRTDYVVRQERVKRFKINPVYTMDKGLDVEL